MRHNGTYLTRVNFTKGETKRAQINRAIAIAIRDGHISVGEVLAAAESLADFLGVHGATIRTVYQDLKAAGIVEKDISNRFKVISDTNLYTLIRR